MLRCRVLDFWSLRPGRFSSLWSRQVWSSSSGQHLLNVQFVLLPKGVQATIYCCQCWSCAIPVCSRFFVLTGQFSDAAEQHCAIVSSEVTNPASNHHLQIKTRKENALAPLYTACPVSHISSWGYHVQILPLKSTIHRECRRWQLFVPSILAMVMFNVWTSLQHLTRFTSDWEFMLCISSPLIYYRIVAIYVVYVAPSLLIGHELIILVPSNSSFRRVGIVTKVADKHLTFLFPSYAYYRNVRAHISFCLNAIWLTTVWCGSMS